MSSLNAQKEFDKKIEKNTYKVVSSFSEGKTVVEIIKELLSSKVKNL
ncbi:hypothetical protein JYG23_00300 [Sedimentibacter sp. zth1]|nr:hypothetical protein [Sedimentibacter sp. zth1]QSX05943.1 hypothetical protein JYG23_00300 [Sedimentibacter sp. zth1]